VFPMFNSGHIETNPNSSTSTPEGDASVSTSPCAWAFFLRISDKGARRGSQPPKRQERPEAPKRPAEEKLADELDRLKRMIGMGYEVKVK